MSEYSRIQQDNSYCHKPNSLYFSHLSFASQIQEPKQNQIGTVKNLSFTTQIPEFLPKSKEPKHNQIGTVKNLSFSSQIQELLPKSAEQKKNHIGTVKNLSFASQILEFHPKSENPKQTQIENSVKNLSFASQFPEFHPKQNQVANSVKTHDKVHHECDQEDGEGEIFGVILSRSRSVSAAVNCHESNKAEKQRGLMKNAAKMTLNMKRSLSVSGGYCRIHHQQDILNGDGENYLNPNVFQKRTVKKKDKILKVCMRILGI